MNPSLLEFVHLVFRWAHLIAGIMWVGSSMFFIWLESNLRPDPDAPAGAEGRLKMVHGGGYWLVEKRHFEPGKVPPDLHWFKWEAYTTWITGASLLVLVYYMGTGYLTDPAVSGLSHWQAVGVGVGSILLGLAVYEAIWRSPLARQTPLALGLCFALFLGAAYALTHLLAGRAAYLHLGAMLGTIMATNVFMTIIPNQRRLVAAVERGEPHDVELGRAGATRSRHNNYMTLPVVFLMISNHFPGTYAHDRAWIVIAVLALAGGVVNHCLNIRHRFEAWLPAAAGTVAAALGAVFLIAGQPAPSQASDAASGETVTFAQAREVVAQRCSTCHSARPTDDAFPAAPLGIAFDTPEQIRMHADRIRTRAVELKTMPLGNKTGMTDGERALLGRWIAQGADLK